eukprot:Nk52_evm84s223 gene=Nk52_evmTU84s223
MAAIHIFNIFRFRESLRFSYMGKMLLLVLFIQALIITGVELAIVLLGDFNKNDLGTDRLVFVFLFIISVVYFIIYTINALVTKNSWQILGLIPLEILYTVYSGLQISSFKQLDTPGVNSIDVVIFLAYSAMGFMVVFSLIISYMAYRIYPEFSWIIYKTIGASKVTRKMFYNYLLFDMLVKVDLLFAFIFVLQMVTTLLDTNDVEFIVSIIMLPLILLYSYFVDRSLRKENRPLFIFLLVLLWGALGYFIFKFYRFYTVTCPKCEELVAANPEKSFLYLEVQSLVNAVFVSATFVVGCICYYYFGKGLKERIQGFGQYAHSQGSRRGSMVVPPAGEGDIEMQENSSGRKEVMENMIVNNLQNEEGRESMGRPGSHCSYELQKRGDDETNSAVSRESDTPNLRETDPEESSKGSPNFLAPGTPSSPRISPNYLKSSHNELLKLSHSDLVLAMLQKEQEVADQRERRLASQTHSLATSRENLSSMSDVDYGKSKSEGDSLNNSSNSLS